MQVLPWTGNDYVSSFVAGHYLGGQGQSVAGSSFMEEDEGSALELSLMDNDSVFQSRLALSATPRLFFDKLDGGDSGEAIANPSTGAFKRNSCPCIENTERLCSYYSVFITS